MKKSEVKIGQTYLAKVSDKVVPVRIDGENARGGWDATNLATNKKVRIKSVQRLRGKAPGRNVEPAIAHEDGRGDQKTEQVRQKKTSGLDAAHLVLLETGKPMRCRDLVETMLGRGLWSTGGKTQAATIYAAILREIQTKGEVARFRKVARGEFVANAA